MAKEKEMTLQIPSHLQFELISRYFTFQTLTPYMVWNVIHPECYARC